MALSRSIDFPDRRRRSDRTPVRRRQGIIGNALDAGATQITVRLEQGGIKRIAITDNGRGIAPEQMPLALARHATSKIASLTDLENVSTLGFRGEALASIASVAQLTLTTRTADGAHAWEISGSQDGNVVPASGAPGTTIDVQDLYFNTPRAANFIQDRSKPNTAIALKWCAVLRWPAGRDLFADPQRQDRGSLANRRIRQTQRACAR